MNDLLELSLELWLVTFFQIRQIFHDTGKAPDHGITACVLFSYEICMGCNGVAKGGSRDPAPPVRQTKHSLA